MEKKVRLSVIKEDYSTVQRKRKREIWYLHNGDDEEGKEREEIIIKKVVLWNILEIWYLEGAFFLLENKRNFLHFFSR